MILNVAVGCKACSGPAVIAGFSRKIHMGWNPPRNHIRFLPHLPHCYSLPSPLSARAASPGDHSHTRGSAGSQNPLDATIISSSNAPDEDTYSRVRVTTLGLAESIERLSFATHRASEFLVLSLGTFSAFDCTMIQIVAQLKMMLQVRELFVRIHCHRLDSFANRATYPKSNKLQLKCEALDDFGAYLSGSCCCFNLWVSSACSLRKQARTLVGEAERQYLANLTPSCGKRELTLQPCPRSILSKMPISEP